MNKKVMTAVVLGLMGILSSTMVVARPKWGTCHSCMPSHGSVLVCNEYKCLKEGANGGCANVDCNNNISGVAAKGVAPEKARTAVEEKTK